MTLAAALLLSACGGGGGSSPAPSMTPTPTPTAMADPYSCPTSGTAGTGSVARAGGSAVESLLRRPPSYRHSVSAAASTTTTRLVVNYAHSTFSRILPQVAAREQALDANVLQTFDYPRLNLTQRVLLVPTASLARTEATLRAQSGVEAVAASSERRYPLTSNAPYWPNNVYFQGFTALQNQQAGNGLVNTHEVPPYSEISAIPGQWDMHAIGLEHAFGYVNGGTGVAQNLNAMGSSSIKIAIIDTGVDASHPELNSKIHYEACFITNLSNVHSTGNYSYDPFGHGTDVAGIAASALNSGLGFAGVGGNAVIYAYRVFPTPDDNCTSENSNDPQCAADPYDIAQAIDDAVSKGVNVISISLGGGGCTGGVDSDPDEGPAVANAIANNVIFVAAAGNTGSNSIEAPACVTGVIAVGATGADDGTATGTVTYTTPNSVNASPTNIIEYVASYSNYSSPNTYQDSSSWGIVAPGGDPSNNDLNAAVYDNLHWIEHIWTSTPFDSNFADTCTSDYPLDSSTLGTPDCRTVIAGTSMATPHVAGAAALILAVKPSYQSPAAMKQLLCQTADNLQDMHQGCGRLNVYRAMAVALGDTNPP